MFHSVFGPSVKTFQVDDARCRAPAHSAGAGRRDDFLRAGARPWRHWATRFYWLHQCRPTKKADSIDTPLTQLDRRRPTLVAPEPDIESDNTRQMRNRRRPGPCAGDERPDDKKKAQDRTSHHARPPPDDQERQADDGGEGRRTPTPRHPLIDDLLQQQSKWPVTNASQAGDGIRAVTDHDGSQPHRPPAPPTRPAPREPLFELPRSATIASSASSATTGGRTASKRSFSERSVRDWPAVRWHDGSDAAAARPGDRLGGGVAEGDRVYD